jgi:mono/diheme cytochrome c family protein
MHPKDEIDFKELLKQPLRLFGLTYIYFLLMGGLIGAYYIWTMNDSTRNTVPPLVLKDSAQFVLEVPMQRGAMIPPVKVADVAKPTKEIIAKGANLYKANCASCHGDNGMGDGLSAAAMTVKPRNFHLAEGWKNGRKIAEIYKTLHDGILPSGMPAFNYNSAEDRFAMIHYIRTFATDYPVDSLSELMNLETVYNLSKGSQMPAQIPVKMALEKIAAEHSGDVKAMQQIAKTIASAKDDAGAKVTMRVAHDTKKIAATTLALQGKSLDMFVKIISADPATAGFKPEVVRLSGEEWSVLYSYLLGLGKERKG